MVFLYTFFEGLFLDFLNSFTDNREKTLRTTSTEIDYRALRSMSIIRGYNIFHKIFYL